MSDKSFSCRPMVLAALILITAAGNLATAAEPALPMISIIIDDMGNHKRLGQRLLDLPYPITLAFLPYRRHTVDQATQAFEIDKEVMLHMPMDNTLGMSLGAGGLKIDMHESQIKTQLRRALRSVPFVSGINNHMGSAFTQQTQQMTWVMEELYRYPVYFVDSRTIASSVAQRVAEHEAIPNMARDVFLDNEQTEAAVHAQFERLLKIARRKGHAIAIGHPYEVTVSYLEKRLPQMDETGIGIATVSGLWMMANEQRSMFAARKPRKLSRSTLAKRHINRSTQPIQIN